MYDPGLISALKQGATSLRTFITITLDSGPVYLWDGVGSSPSFNGNVHIGVGSFGSIEFGEDGLSKVARPFTLTMSGNYEDHEGNTQVADGWADVIGRTLTNVTLQNKEVIVSIALMDINESQVLYSVVDKVRGRIDVAKVSEDENGSKILTLEIEDRTLLFNMVNPRKLSQETHREVTPNSTFLSQSAILRTIKRKWGVA